MKKIYTYLTLGFIAALGTSCEKVIDIDLNDSEAKVVIEANIHDNQGPHMVRLTKSINFDEANDFPAISGATVTISDNEGNSEILTEAQSGVYLTSTLQGVSGRTYSLEVKIGDEVYTASSTMYAPVDIDTITIEKSFFGSGHVVIVELTDPAGIENYYNVVEYQNGAKNDDNNFNIGDDQLLDGDNLTFVYFYDEGDIQTGDNLLFEVQTIDKGVYDYFRTFNQLSAASQSASPANPISNISNGALGYFSASARTAKVFVVPQL